MATRSSAPGRLLLLTGEVLIFIGVASVSKAYAKDGARDGAMVLAAARDDIVFAPEEILDAQTVPVEAEQATPLILMVSVNGMDRGLESFFLIGSELWTTREVLRRLGILINGSGEQLVSLSRLPGVDPTYNSREQRLDLMVQPAMLAIAATTRNVEPDEVVVAETSEGLVLNYDATVAVAGSDLMFTGFNELRYFNGSHVVETTGLVRTGAGFGRHDGFTRLDSAWTYSVPERRLSIRAGDTLTVPARWTRSVRAGGVQIGTNFDLQPYLNTAPLPSFVGSATLPSKVDLYINGVRRYTGALPSGPFEIGSGPTVIDGFGQAQVVLTDITGRVTTLDYRIYDTPLLLREGLVDWSVETGLVRENYAIRSFDYGDDVFVSGNLRYGVSNRLTLDTHVEASDRYYNGGVGGAIVLGAYGVVEGALGLSRNAGDTGQAWKVGYSWINGTFRVAGEMMRASADYADLAELAGSPHPSKRDVVHAGFYDRTLGTFGASYVSQKYPRERPYRYVNLSWQKPVNRAWWISVRAQQQLEREKETSVYLTLTWSPGRRDTFRASVQQVENETFVNFNARRSIPLDGGFGWNLDTYSDDGEFGGSAQVDFLGDHAEASAGVSSRFGHEAGYANMRGALVLMEGDVYPARRIYDGFALVTADGREGIPVLLHNREVGKTDEDGKLLITGLNAYQRNRVAIDATDLPVELEVVELDREAVPADRAGVTVRFPIMAVRSMLLTLVLPSGEVVPVGTRVRYLDGSGPEMVTGYDGQLYAEAARPGAVLVVETATGPCEVVLPADLPAERAGRVGAVICNRGSGVVQ